MQVPSLPMDRPHPKERVLLDLVSDERLKGYRLLIYAGYTREIIGRMNPFRGRRGSRVVVMKADAVPPDRREAWVAKSVEEGVDVLVCHPRPVQTGLDLVDFPTIVWFETDFAICTVRQAFRRSWRIDQTPRV